MEQRTQFMSGSGKKQCLFFRTWRVNWLSRENIAAAGLIWSTFCKGEWVGGWKLCSLLGLWSWWVGHPNSCWPDISCRPWKKTTSNASTVCCRWGFRLPQSHTETVIPSLKCGLCKLVWAIKVAFKPSIYKSVLHQYLFLSHWQWTTENYINHHLKSLFILGKFFLKELDNFPWNPHSLFVLMQIPEVSKNKAQM